MLMTICVNAGSSAPKPLNSALELRDHENQQDDGHDYRDREHRARVEQCLLDLLLQRFGLFLVGGDLLQHRLERAGVLARLDQVGEQVIEVQRVLGQRLVQRIAGLDVRLDGQHQFLYGRLVVADADDLEGLHHRDAGGEHRRELAGKDRNVLGRYLAVALEQAAFLAHPRRRDALASQRCAQVELVPGQAPALDAVAFLVLAFPEIGKLLYCDRSGHVLPACCAQSTVTRLISSSVVMPSRTFFRPACRRLQTPSRAAASLICITLPPSMMMRPISSVTGITS